MRFLFVAISEPLPGIKWRRVFDRHWHAYSRWFLRGGIQERASYLDGFRAIKKYMPELAKPYEQICEAAGDGDLEARFLSMWCPPAYVGGCSQVVRSGKNPILARNYDYSPELFEGTWLNSRLTGKGVIAVVDCLWGALDGINEDGLAVSLAFGGRRDVGEGFGIPIVLRYVLECAENVKEAIAILRRVPVHMSYSVALVDKGGDAALVYLNPDRPAEVANRLFTTNHQHGVTWPRHAAATKSVEREAALQASLPRLRSGKDLVALLQKPPLYQNSYARGYGTLYTALYRPENGSVELFWPGRNWRQSFDNWVDDELPIEIEV